MLFGIPPTLPADLLHALARMGHGDEIVFVDTNYPSFSDARGTVLGAPLELVGRNLPEALADVLALLPLDSFVDEPVAVMAVPGGKTPSVHSEVANVLESVPGAPWPLGQIERFGFYERSRKAFAIVRTAERRPYGNAILVKGVIAPDGELMTPEIAKSVG